MEIQNRFELVSSVQLPARKVFWAVLLLVIELMQAYYIIMELLSTQNQLFSYWILARVKEILLPAVQEENFLHLDFSIWNSTNFYCITLILKWFFLLLLSLQFLIYFCSIDLVFQQVISTKCWQFHYIWILAFALRYQDWKQSSWIWS